MTTPTIEPRHRKTLEYVFRMGDVSLRVFEITKTIRKNGQVERRTMTAPAVHDCLNWRYLEYANPQRSAVRITDLGKAQL